LRFSSILSSLITSTLLQVCHLNYPLRSAANTTISLLLDHPSELRLEIYGHIINAAPVRYSLDSDPVPTSANVADYQGLTLSCRQIHDEFESEAIRVVRYFLDTVQKE
jgi:hypothetical protein